MQIHSEKKIVKHLNQAEIYSVQKKNVGGRKARHSALNSSTPYVGRDRQISVNFQPGLQSELQAPQSYIMRICLPHRKKERHFPSPNITINSLLDPSQH